MNVPDGWRVALLSDVCTVGPRDPALPETAPFVPMDAVKVGVREPAYYEPRGKRGGIRAKGNDLLFARITPCLENGKVSLLPPSSGPTGGSTEFLVVRPGANVDPRYLYLWSLSPAVRDRAKAEMTGTTGRMRLSGSALGALPFPHPPLPEQRRIVEMVEEHMAHLDAADASLASAERHVATLKAGKLRGLLVGPTRKLGDLAVESRYGTSTKCEYTGTGIGVARIPNLVHGAVVMADEKRAVDPTVDLSDLRLSAGDVLIVRTNGSANLIGRSAVVENDMNVAFASYLIRYRFDTSVVHPRWVHLCLESLPVRRQLEARAASSAGQYNLGLKKLHTVEIPVPSMQEQSTAIHEWDAFSSTLCRLGESAARQRLRSTALRRAMLAAAFSGRLTPHRASEG